MVYKRSGLSAVIMIMILFLTLSACTAASANINLPESSSASREDTCKPSTETESESDISSERLSETSDTKTSESADTKSDITEATFAYKETEPVTVKTEPVATVAPTDVSVRVTKESSEETTKKKKSTTSKVPSYSKPDVPSEFPCFDNCAFIGNSRLLAAGNYNLAKHVYAAVGLNVDTVYTKKCEGSSVVVIDELNGKNYEKVFLMFGDNECGWPDGKVFAQHYAKVIASVRERIPDTEVYLISVLPISYAKSQQNEYGYNKNSINNINKFIKQLCEDEGCTYVDAATSITNSSGYLPDEASTDGCHMGKEYTRIWLNAVAESIEATATTTVTETTTVVEEKTTRKFEPIIPGFKEIFK